MKVPNLLPSTRMILWGIVFGLLAVALVNNVEFVGKLVAPRS